MLFLAVPPLNHRIYHGDSMKKKLFCYMQARLTFALFLCAVLVFGGVPSVVKVQAQSATNQMRLETETSEPQPQVSFADTVRFLEQTTWGPTPDLIARVQSIGFDAFLIEQRDAPISSYTALNLPFVTTAIPVTCVGACVRDQYNAYPLQVHFFRRALNNQDQLRQRMAFALHKIFVVSLAGRNPINQPSWMVPYLDIFDRQAFGNYRQILEEVTLNPAMGRYLDMMRSTRTAPNENYPREILQLFSIGLFELNIDGTLRRDGAGNPIPTYDQTRINEFAKAFTGWYEAAQIAPGIINYRDPMRVWLPEATYHDQGTKQLLNYPGAARGGLLPAGQATRQDLTDALDNIFNHPNVGPFISKLLIQNFVTSNPSPGYVARVATVFNNNGAGVRGDLASVLYTILMDPEARGDAQTAANYGRLREPVQLVLNILRMTAAQSDGVLAGAPGLPGGILGVDNFVGRMEQDVMRPPTVFSYYSPDYEIPGTTPPVLGPEFNIFTTMTTLERTNFINRVIFSTIPPATGGGGTASPDRPTGTSINLSGIQSYAADPQQLAELLNQYLLHGTMSAAMRDRIVVAVNAVPASQPLTRVKQAVYLVLTSSQYQVER